MEKNKLNQMSNMEKKIVLAEVIFILGVFVYLFIATTPRAIAPISGMSILEPDFVFEIENGERVLISYNENFTNLIELEEGDEITLPPGTYYWKVKSDFRESVIQKLVIEGNVGLDIERGDESYTLRNTGNVGMNVGSKEKNFSFSLATREAIEMVEDDVKYEGRQE